MHSLVLVELVADFLEGVGGFVESFLTEDAFGEGVGAETDGLT